MPPLAHLLKGFLDSSSTSSSSDTSSSSYSPTTTLMSTASSDIPSAKDHHNNRSFDVKSESLCSLDLAHLSPSVGGDGDGDGDSDIVNLKQSSSKKGRRSKSMSLPSSTYATQGSQDMSMNPLFYNEEDSSEEVLKQNRGCQPRGPLSIISSLVSCLHHKTPESKAWQKRRAAALMELSKRQQAALSDKQDTIDMLEWQLEQLQLMSGKEHGLQEVETCTTTTSASSSPTAVLQESKKIIFKASSAVDSTAADAVVNNQNNNNNNNNNNSSSRMSNVNCSEKENNCSFLVREESPIHDSQISATVVLFEMAVIRARLSIRYFCNVFIKQMEVSGYPVCRTLAAMEPSTCFLRKEHTAFVLDSRINKAFFHCFENESFDESGLMKILDPLKRCAVRLEEYKKMKLMNVSDAVNINSSGYESEFLRFCQTKTKEMWGLFELSMVFRSSEEREAFTGAFLDVAKGVWLLHKLAYSINPSVVIIRVGRGMEMNPLYVEPVAYPDSIITCPKCNTTSATLTTTTAATTTATGAANGKVEFMIMPGFRAHKKIIKCQVYQHIKCR